ncbi:nickel transporter [Methylobacillus gramineus]|uniref:HisA/HisF-related TIM barrel protein n=1 Tax=Methylobacillus gramineus TaxID=755169 RepID=UPI001CFF6A5B|nr:HisA/HisF-related TIM barrel protein [Methylobacillus gramineus]MCB5184489.1 nickel transporter [Methylobacillus gramineus]
MKVIPVIDLMHGQVVHAKKGERQHYQPIQSALCNSSAPLDIVAALLELYPFKQMYIADIDAIQQRGNHSGTIAEITKAYPQLEIWLDAGISSVADLATWTDLNLQIIIGSESLSDLNTYQAIAQACNARFTLSLDFSLAGYQGPAELLSNIELWPDNVIIMTLQQVGSQAGPDFDRLKAFKQEHFHLNIYAAGGTRHLQDVMHLAQLEIAGVLVASALHHGSLSATELFKINPASHHPGQH